MIILKISKNNQTIAALLITVLGSLVSTLLVVFGEEETREVINTSALAVETVRATRGDYRLGVEAWGFIEPRETIAICPEVAGRISLVPGKIQLGAEIGEGELLFTIDDRKYRSILTEAKGATTLARQEIETEKGRQIIAKKEWELMQSSDWKQSTNKPLALRVPQLKAKEAALQIAAAREQQAALDLERTRVKAPCKGVILEENIAKGQLLEVGDTALVLGCSEAYHILANYSPGSELGFTTQSVHIRVATKEYTGRIKAVSQVIDPKTRQKRALIEFDANQVGEQASGQVVIGEYSRLTLPGRYFQDVLILPKKTVRAAKSVWVIGEDSTLEIRRLTVAGQDSQNVIVTGGVTEQDRIVVSQIASPLVGMQLREKNIEPQISGVYSR